jgi:signal transduction histidine kinase
MGMGLSIVRALVGAYNGRIWFDSTLNQGSTFTFIIPTHQPAEILLP